MKNSVLLVAAAGGVAAIVGGFAGISWLLAAGAVTTFLALIALPWLRTDAAAPPSGPAPEIIARFSYRHDAEYAQGFLNDAGIQSSVFVDDAGGSHVGMALSNPARLVVGAPDHDRARAVLDDAGLLE